jgi:NAD(P)-dependent dehydrogenase (short-subunit alcohol dehydrogenase family)
MFEGFAGGAALVFGATGGVGAAFVRQLNANGSFAVVIEASRRSSPAFDLTDEASIATVVAAAAAQAPLRLVIDATGFLHDELQGPRNFALNAIGPALIMKHVLPLLPSEGKAVFATLSARVGSIGDNQLGGWYGYRASKAALNQLMRTAAIEMRRRRPNAICVSLHPGTVNTGLSSPFAKDGLDVQTPDQSAARLVQVIDGLQPSDNGCFFDHNGKPIPW